MALTGMHSVEGNINQHVAAEDYVFSNKINLSGEELEASETKIITFS